MKSTSSQIRTQYEFYFSFNLLFFLSFFIHKNVQQLTIRTVNSSRSAFSCFSFNSTFFLSFDPHLTKSALKIGNQNVTIVPENNERTFNDESLIEDTEHFKCKIPSKVFISKCFYCV